MARQLSRGGGRKNDRIHSAAAARVAALQGDARPLEAEGPAGASAVLDERRVNLAQARVCAVNPTPRPAGALLAGGALTDLSANTTAAPLRTVRPTVRLSGAAKRSPETWLPRSAPRKHAWSPTPAPLPDSWPPPEAHCPEPGASDRSWLDGGAADPSGAAVSPTRPPSQTPQEPHQPRSPAPTSHDTESPGAPDWIGFTTDRLINRCYTLKPAAVTMAQFSPSPTKTRA
jgi:hypothetical protein